MATQVSPMERNMRFAQQTRKNLQKLPTLAMPENSTVQFTVPKTRLLSKIFLLVEGTFTLTHASQTSCVVKRLAPFTYLRNIALNVNNGFRPFNISGAGLYLLNKLRLNSDILDYASSGRKPVVVGNTASSGGTQNTMKMIVELPLTINDRDPVGLILAQNEETVITVQVDTADVYGAIFGSASGYTVSDVSVTMTPLVETFSIPNDPNAVPDLSILKVVQENTYAISQTGDVTVKLPLGTTYRRLLLDFYDGFGNAFTDTDLSGMQLIFNQADVPYNLDVKHLVAINALDYGDLLPDGVLAFDFATQGLPNYANARDYIDTQGLTEFWVRTNSGKTGTVRVVSESLARLRG